MAQYITRDKVTGQWYDYDDVTGKKTPREATKPFAPYTHPSGMFSESDIPNPVGRSLANILPSLGKNLGEGIVGLPQAVTQIPDLIDYATNTDPSKFKGEGSPNDRMARIGNSIMQNIAGPYQPENIKETLTQDPGRVLLDLDSIVSPFIKGKGLIDKTLDAVSALKPVRSKSLLENPILNYFGKSINPAETFDIPTLGATPSTVADAIREAQSMGWKPTITQMGGKPSGAAIEAANPHIAEVLRQQDEGIFSRLQDELANASPQSQMRSSQVRMFGSPEDVVAPTLKDAQAAFVAKQKELAGRSKLLGKNFGVDTAEEASGLIGNSSGQPFRDKLKSDPALAKAFKQYFLDKEKFERVSNLDEVRPLLEGRMYSNDAKKTPPLVEKPNVDPTVTLKRSIESEESAARYLQGEGITREHLKQNLLADMIQTNTDAKGNLNPRGIINYLGEKGAQFRLATPGVEGGKWRAGMQRFAHSLEMRAKSGDVENLALKINNAAGSGEMNIIGAVSPVAAGQPVMKGRAGFGSVQFINAKIKGKFIGKLLNDPDVPWILARMSQLPKNSPSVMSNLKSLAKIAGQLNVPVKFVVNGEEYNLGSDDKE